MSTTTSTLKPGDQVHFLAAMTVPISPDYGAVLQRGATIELTEQMIEATRDRNGVSWLDLVDDDEAQIERWGQVTFHRGECPDSITSWNGEDGAGMRGLLRTQEIEEARLISHPGERRERIAEITAKYGAAPTSWTIATYKADGDQKFGPSAR